MKKPLLVICLLAAIVYACNQQSSTANKLLKTGNLPTQSFVIDISKDTVLTTKKGALIRIPKGALTADDNIVKLEVKEAYSMRDIVMAGLTTQSNGQPLSSGGMIYINAVSENNVRIKEKLFIATPSPSLEKNMQLFKGEVKGDSTINWTNPKPMPENPQLTALEKGKTIFQDNCASCHSITKDLTGPALGGVLQRTGSSKSDLRHLYEFTRNPAKAVKYDSYYQCLKAKYGGAMMTAFPNLTDENLDNIYGYIENETKRLNVIRTNNLKSCKDSCETYFEIAGKWKQIKEELEKDSSSMTEHHSDFAIDTITITDFQPEEKIPIQPIPEQLDKIDPADNKSLYYQFTIESFGWFNVDILTKNLPTMPSELMVRIQGQYKERFDICLIIPSIKLLAAGGPLKNKKDTYGFYTTDGNIPLPQQREAYIIAFGEYEDKIIFAKREFITQEKGEFDLELTTITKEAFDQQIASLELSDVTFKVNDTKNAAELRKAVKELKNAEELKPKNCDCDCYMKPMLIDSSSPIEWSVSEK